MKYIPILELPILIIMVIIRSQMLRRQGINAFVFGKTNKSDFLLPPIVFTFFYGIVSSVFDLPFPAIFKRHFFDNQFSDILAIIICTVSLIWFLCTIIIFGKSFRVGIDENTKNELITKGTFSISRNPIYVGFITFFIGIFIAYPGILSAGFLILMSAAIHRQIIREEEFLKMHYKDEYINYCKKVRRYL
jgi:protein-S-isoprenylcysteine O-methyltransferase Ste14